MKNMRTELAASYTACEQEFRDRSIVVKIQINLFREEIDAVRDKLRELSVNIVLPNRKYIPIVYDVLIYNLRILIWRGRR